MQEMIQVHLARNTWGIRSLLLSVTLARYRYGFPYRYLVMCLFVDSSVVVDVTNGCSGQEDEQGHLVELL